MQTMNAFPHPCAAAPIVVPASAPAWASAHHFHRIADPSSFAWLSGLSPQTTTPPQVSLCFGMDVVYLPLDVLRWFPNELVLAIPFLTVPPVEFFFACNEGGKRWWCFVVLSKAQMVLPPYSRTRPIRSLALTFHPERSAAARLPFAV